MNQLEYIYQHITRLENLVCCLDDKTPQLFFITIWQRICFRVVKQGVIAISPRKALQQQT